MILFSFYYTERKKITENQSTEAAYSEFSRNGAGGADQIEAEGVMGERMNQKRTQIKEDLSEGNLELGWMVTRRNINRLCRVQTTAARKPPTTNDLTMVFNFRRIVSA